MKIGVIIDCYKTDLVSALNLAADAGADGAQIYGKPELMADSVALTKLWDAAQKRNVEISAIVADVADYQLDEKRKYHGFFIPYSDFGIFFCFDFLGGCQNSGSNSLRLYDNRLGRRFFPGFLLLSLVSKLPHFRGGRRRWGGIPL